MPSLPPAFRVKAFSPLLTEMGHIRMEQPLTRSRQTAAQVLKLLCRRLAAGGAGEMARGL